MVLEYWPWGLRRMGDRAEDLMEILRNFPFGAILREGEHPPQLAPIDRLLERLAWLPTDGSDEGFLERTAEVP